MAVPAEIALWVVVSSCYHHLGPVVESTRYNNIDLKVLTALAQDMIPLIRGGAPVTSRKCLNFDVVGKLLGAAIQDTVPTNLSSWRGPV